ncbi:MAM and LDL-receptor class A domain-containing protein 1 isoform X1 [Hydra vulgaris]|uniref:MAM and LDL-receptor class A domain-containing protein 1 isoform X1 n=1 Tax=Hydra vulgaris TaxID=6087 RepID=UPI001F5E3DD7|nr:MAM and LDL-receptor class A domain-containing protein 1 isoform X1 [Hydra vulgaris]
MVRLGGPSRIFSILVITSLLGIISSQDCDFENGLCNWTQSKKDKFDWTRISGSTASQGTGPQSDHTSLVKNITVKTTGGNANGAPCVFPYKFKNKMYTKCITQNTFPPKPWCATVPDYDKSNTWGYCQPAGFYIYIEADNPRNPGDTASLISPVIQKGPKCLTFWYHMYGLNIDTLSLFTIQNGNRSNPLWRLKGNQGDSWKSANMTVGDNTPFQIEFEATRGLDYRGDISLDDITVKDGSCVEIKSNSSANDTGYGLCTFEKDKCGFNDDPSGQFKWTRMRGSTPSTKTGPSSDHTTGTISGYFVYVEASNKKLNDKGRFYKTFTNLSPKGSCLKFWYHMFGSDMGDLNVYINPPALGKGTPDFNATGQKGDIWVNAEVPITTTTAQVVFEGITKYGYEGDMAIDDIELSMGLCNKPGFCDFENGLCTWYNIPAAENSDDFDWIVGSGSTPTAFTGPSADRNGNDKAKYLFIESSSPNRPNEKARLASQLFSQSNSIGQCFLFYYHMYGQSIGSLNIYANFSGTEKLLWTLSGNKGNTWFNGQVNVGIATTAYRIIIEGIVGNFVYGDIAVDDFSFRSGNCAVVPADANPITQSTTVKPSTTATAPTAAPIFNCDFEFGLCSSWSQDVLTDQLNWTIASGATASDGTGPSFDHTKNNQFGKYAYLEVSAQKENDVARLISTSIPATGDTGAKCLEFWYHMYGPHVNTLNIYVLLGGHVGKPLWSRTGTQGNRWLKGQVNLVGRQPFQAVIEATVGKSYLGDIAIDDISLTTSKCLLSTTTCTFENDQCGYRDDQSSTSQLVWKRQSQATSSNNGPSIDHTLQSYNGFYMFVDSSKGKQGDIARLFSPIEPITTGKCLSFWYHMNGKTMGSLSIYLSINDQVQNRPIWSESGNKGDVWRISRITLSATDTYEIVFEGSLGGVDSYMAIDDIKLSEGPCQSPGYCDFEVDTCTYTNSKFDNFDWIRGSAGTPSLFTGPKFDHTVGNSSGSYIFLETSSPTKKGDVAILESEQFNPISGSRCLTFWYHMYGADIGSLQVVYKVFSGSQSEQLVWNLTGQQQLSDVDQWKFARVPISADTNHVIMFKGIAGDGWLGDIALDDIQFTSLACVLQPPEANPNGKPTQVPPTTLPQTRPPTLAPTALSCDFEKDFCSLIQDSTDTFNWTRNQGFTDTSDSGPSTDHTFGNGAVTLYGPGSIRHISAKCIHVLNGAHIKPKDDTTLVLYEGCGQNRLEFQLTSDGLLKLTMYNMCVRLRGDSTASETEVTISDTCTTKWTITGSGQIQHQSTGMCISPLGNTLNPGNNLKLVAYKACNDDSKRFSFSPTLGFYAYIEASSPRKENDTARLVSPIISSSQCLNFWYHMYGLHVNRLNVYTKTTNKMNLVWSKYGSHGNQWRAAHVFLNSTVPYQYVFEAIRGKGYSGDIAIDDVTVSSTCPAPVECTFEETDPPMCGWINDNNDIFDWSIGQGSTSSSNTGPENDHTYNDDNGKYLYIETSILVSAGSIARLISPLYAGNSKIGGQCFQFWYHMYGTSIGKLSLLLEKGNAARALMWTRQGNQGNQWFIGQASVLSQGGFKLIFEATRGLSYTGDIAIDDLIMHDGACNSPATCDFENEKCTWKNVPTEDTFDWVIGQGSTPSLLTGPSADHSKQNGEGKYIFIETSSPQKSGDTARLVSEQLNAQSVSAYCLRFWYHMNGADIGTLNVYIKTGIGKMNEKVVWSLSGNQGNNWLEGTAPVLSQKDFYLVFEAVHGGSYNGDIALDDIVYSMGACFVVPKDADPFAVTTSIPPSPSTTPMLTVYGCNFETKTLCQWSQDLTDKFNWTLNSGTTSSDGSGPNVDHTYGNKTGTYLYIEASYPRVKGDIARILSPLVRGDKVKSRCFQFWYHMYGPDIGSLNVYRKSGNSMLKLWIRVGDNGNVWRLGQVDLFSQLDYQVVVEAVRGGDFKGDISIDDIDLIDGSCPPTAYCDFEHGICGYNPDPKAEFYWTRNKGETSSDNTGPSFDHTLQTDQGYYIYTEVSGTRKLGDRARLVSPVIPDKNPRCLEFWFHMRGWHIGQLNIYIQTPNGGNNLIWRREGNHGDTWKVANAPIRPQNGRQIVIEGVRGMGYAGDIAVDDVKIIDGYCPPPGECSFEAGMCTWSNTKSNLDTFDWIIGSGGTPSFFTGPDVDHTTGSKEGFYMYIEASDTKSGDRAWLLSEDFTPTLSRCIDFWVHMLGSDIGTLNVHIRGQNGTMTRIWTLSGSQGTKWINGQAPIVSTVDYQIVFEAITTAGFSGDIAIDDIVFSEYKCTNIPANSVPPDPTTPPPTTVTTTPMPTPIPNFYTCNFTFDKCSWYDDLTAKFTWTRNQGTTSSVDTGPTSDHTTGASGWYIFIETSWPRVQNDTARLMSASIPATSKICLEFWYHMFGDHIGNLTVYTMVQNKSTAVWTKSGTQGQKWKHAVIHLTSASKFQVVFEGIVGPSYRGDIALDDLSLTEGSCPPQAECTFEDPDLCGWTNIGGDDFDWTRDNAGTSSSGTGPQNDNTFGTAAGYYMYIETSTPQTKGHKAWLKSPNYSATIGRCLSFWYHMYGQDIGTLNVLINQNGSRSAPIWTLSGEQGGLWRPTRVTIKSFVSHSIIFEGITGPSYRGDIALDDVMISEGPCPDPGFCDFESDLCAYTNMPYGDQFDWQVGSGTTSSVLTGPTTDHSTGTALGQYIFIETSYPRLAHEAAILRSETVPTSGDGKCVQFWYHMYGSEIGKLEVNMRVGNDISETIVWELSGDQGNVWKQGQAPFLSRGQNMEIRFEGIRGYGYKGDIAIDDITVTNFAGSCPVQPTQAQPWGCNFELGFCKWTQSNKDDFDWTLNKGQTSSVGTGPTVDHTTNTTKGTYIYLETSWPRKENDTAALISPIIPGNGTRATYCLWFAYHMYGPHVDTLKVYTQSQGQTRPPIWIRKGSKGPEWRHAEVSVDVLYDTQVIIEGTRGTDYKGDIAIDDIDLWWGDCYTSGVCTFEGADICFWYVDTSKQLKWERASGSTSSVQTGPSNDHTYGTDQGHYMYIETSNAPPNTEARMYSPWYYNFGQSCVQFFYHMYGVQVNELNIFIRYAQNANSYLMFSKVGNQNNTWRLGQASVLNVGYFQIIVRGVKGQGYQGDIAVDDFRIREGACPAVGNCDFEHIDFCSWEQENSDHFDWIIGSGATSSTFTGPSTDHTTQTNGGYYAFIESSSPRVVGDKASLKSEIFTPTPVNGRCFSFWYHMYGASIGTLNVYIRSLNQGNFIGNEIMWQLIGNQGNQWFQGRMGLNVPTDYQIVVEAIRGASYTGDIAVDDFEFTVGSCSLLPIKAWPPGKTTLAPTPAITTSGPTAGNQGNDCNFDINTCVYSTNSSSKTFNWLRHQGPTDSYGTGPRNDHTTNSGKGYYMYVDASSPAKVNDSAWLVQSGINNNNGFCVSFWYHMFGPHVGTLNIWLLFPSQAQLKWKRMASQGDKWKHGQIYIPRKDGSPFTIVFEAIRGSGYAGDISLDDITFVSTDQGCPGERECTFEAIQWPGSGVADLLCGWTQEKVKDNFDWTITSGSTSSAQTGPSTDHTLKTSQGRYIYIETSWPQKAGDKAMIISQSYTATRGQCFTFWYHKYGSTVSNFTLYTRIDNIDTPIWSRGAYDEGNVWRPALVTIKSPLKPFQLVFEAFVGSGFTGDIAIDDILLQDGECPLPGDCDFEDFESCTYEQEPTEDNFDWIRGNGETSSWRTGPSKDNTKNDKSGSYYYIEASYPQKKGDKARMTSELFRPTNRFGRCLQFYRHLYGASIGTLNVYVKYGAGNSSDAETLIWSDSGNQGDSWIQSQVPVYSSSPYRLVFEAVVGSSYTGDIAIDDISFNNNFSPCTYIPPNSQPPTVPPTTITPSDSNCTFETPCRWKQLTTDNFDWTFISGATGTYGTGPLGDHTTGKGTYAYIEASYPRKPNDTAVLRSPPIRATLGAVCFSFYFHMHGADINALNVYSVYNGVRTKVWTRFGTQGNRWRHGQVNIRGISSIFNIDIEGVRGISYEGDISIDDIVVSDGKCPPTRYCDFENGNCDWENILTDKFDWTRSNGGTSTFGTGPSTDHTTGTALGSYFYIETSYPRKRNDNAILRSPLYPANSKGSCFNFWYHMYGQDIGSLNIYVGKLGSVPAWNLTSDQGNVWRHGRVTVQSLVSFYIYIEGVVGKSFQGDIAIDDIMIEDYPCPAPGSCDFESQSFCGWTQVLNKKNTTGFDDFDWILNSGSTPSWSTGPSVDHTKGTALGTYAFIESSGIPSGSRAQLISEIFPATKGNCLSFWYHMFGDGIGSINFYIKTISGSPAVVKSIEGNQGDKWIQGEVGLHSQNAFSVIIEAVHGSSYTGDIAIDDLEILSGNCVGTCSSIKPTARVACGPGSVTPATCTISYGCCYDDSVPNVPKCFQHPATCNAVPIISRQQCGFKSISKLECGKLGCCYDSSTSNGIQCFFSLSNPTDFPPTIPPTTEIPPSIYDCSFETGLCGFLNINATDSFDWTRHKGETGSWGTGPTADHTLGTKDGYYIYIETSFNKENDTANLVSPFIDFPPSSPIVCVRFWYHMYGQHVGSLNVFHKTTANMPTIPVWTRSGAMVNDWLYGQFVVPSGKFQVVFQGKRGPGYQGDISLDDISFFNGACPPQRFCDFENNDLCGWIQDASDNFDWTIGFGNTTSWDTGPKSDHTYGTPTGKYLFIEGSWPRQPGDKARIESYSRAPTDGTCFEFYYHMKGVGIGTLNVFIRRGKIVDALPLWTLSGEQGDEWFRATMNVKEPMQEWKVILEGIRGADYYSDIAIDDLVFHNGECVPVGDCDFEDGNACGYQNDPSNKVDWLVYTGPTPSHNTGPSTDHTTGLPTGQYLFMESSYPAQRGDISRFVSEKFKVNPNFKWCIEFWYNMHGNGVGALRVRTKYKTPYSKGAYYYSYPLFSMEGNLDDLWHFGQANITSSYDFQIVFEGEVGSGVTYQSDIALDDLNVTLGQCDPPAPPPTPIPCLRKCKDGTCISSDKVCDFYPDCAQGKDSTDNTDEDGCDGCDFETGVCGWTNNTKGLFSWRRQAGGTATANTGPTTDHTKGTNAGYYLYVEASLGKSFELATFSSPQIKQASSTCAISFWYHMYGSSIGELVVSIVIGFRLTKVWEMYGDQGNKWQQAIVYINRRTSPFNIRFTAERSTSFTGDIAIDDISLQNCALPKPSQWCYTGYYFQCIKTKACISYSRMCDFTDDCGDNSDEDNCPFRYYPYRCNFESSFCQWQNLKDDQFDFTRTKGVTDSDGTGPLFDHTTGTTSGFYIYAESSYPRQLGDKARIASAALKPTDPQRACSIRFYYHMVGDHIGVLRVKTRQCTNCPETTVWTRSTPAGNFWVRTSIRLTSILPFQVIIEAEIGSGYLGDIAIDDVSFDECNDFYGILPTAIPTTPTIPTTTPCLSDQFYCMKDNKCITKYYVCDYRNDCSDGQDEQICGPCNFETSGCGYTDASTGNLEFRRSQPLKEGGPKFDKTKNSTSGFFALLVPGSGSTQYTLAKFNSPTLSKTGPNCVLEFSYFSNKSNYLVVFHNQDVNSNNVASRVWSKYVSGSNSWITTRFGVGQRPDGWSLSFQAQYVYAAYDDIVFKNCDYPVTTNVCNKMQTRCESGVCIYPYQMCDFTNDCGDSSDEKLEICANYKERCNFEVDTCNWYQDKDDDFDWTWGSGGTSSSDTGPGTDHTEGTRLGKYLFIETSSPRKPNDTARLLSTVFRPSNGTCTMRFFYHMFGEDIDTLSVWLKTSTAASSLMQLLWSKKGDQGDIWLGASIDIMSTKNYQIAIEGRRGLSYSGDIAIDDISFTIGCNPDMKATLDPTMVTPSPPPGCKGGEFACGDGQCIPASQYCDFISHCKNDADEKRCPSKCDFENGDGCMWTNAYYGDSMDWTVHQGKTPSNDTGPPYDHTKGTPEGYYLYMEADQSKGSNFPNAHYVSPMYYKGGYKCTFSFWYNMYHLKVTGGNDASLNILYRKSGRDTKVWQSSQSTGDQWKNATVELPPCPKNFRIVFEGSHYWGTQTDAAIDDWSFDCAEPVPPLSCNSDQFQCKETKQCIPIDSLCDLESDCCDGSDESAALCKDYKKLDFESGLNDFVQLTSDDFNFDIQSGKTSSSGTGPKTDHTLKEEHGKYAYIEASVRSENDTAQLASSTIAATKPGSSPTCFVSFWYHMYGIHIGTLSVSTATQYGVVENTVWSKSKNQGDKWFKGKVNLVSSQDFQVIFTAVMGTSFRGDIAIDDIMFSPGCIFNNKPLPGGPTQPPIDPCLPNFQCRLTGVCISRILVCDFSEDCLGGTDEDNITCGYPQGFEYGFQPWSNPQFETYDFILNSGKTPTVKTGPSTDARGSKEGFYAYLEVTGKTANKMAVLSSPVYGAAYAECYLEFYYHMYGIHVSLLEIHLIETESPMDSPDTTTLFELLGDQGDKWVKTRVFIGRRYLPFYINFTAHVGDGDQGDIALDEITFTNCGHAPPCTGNDPGKFMCDNNRCIAPDKICNFVDDCGDSSDETIGDICSEYVGCDFENLLTDACNFTQETADDFDWTLNQGWTPSYNTGPTRDHTYGTSQGHYMYIEATGRKEGDKARLMSLPVQAKKGGNCTLRFFYHMTGLHVKDLNIYLLKDNAIEFVTSANGDYGDVWTEFVVNLSTEYNPFRIIFEGVVGKSYASDIAIDDIILNPDCLINGTRTFPTKIPCTADKFRCNESGQCVSNTSRCDGKKDCRDNSDEKGCGDGDSKTGKRIGNTTKKSSGMIAASVVGGLILLLVVIFIAYMITKKRRETKLQLFSVFYDPTKPPEEKKKEPKCVSVKQKPEGLSNPIYDAQPIGDFAMGELDTNMFVDDAFTVPASKKSGATSMSNPLYQDPYMEDEDGPLDNF